MQPTTPHSGRLWGGVQAPNEPDGTSPLTANATATEYLNMPRWGRGMNNGKNWRGKRVERRSPINFGRGTNPCLVTEGTPDPRDR